MRPPAPNECYERYDPSSPYYRVIVVDEVVMSRGDKGSINAIKGRILHDERPGLEGKTINLAWTFFKSKFILVGAAQDYKRIEELFI